MKLEEPLFTKNLMLSHLRSPNINKKYLGWLQNPDINRFLEVRFGPPKTKRQLRSYVSRLKKGGTELLLGIFLISDGRHIGNIKLGPIWSHHRRAEIGILIGESDQWGKGFACEAISALATFSEEELGLNQLTARCYAANKGSLKAFQASGFLLEATLPDYYLQDDGEPTHALLLRRLRISQTE